MSRDEGVGYYVVLSAFGAALVILMAVLGATHADSATDMDRVLVGTGFILSSLFGISIAVRPGWLGRLAGKGVHGADQADSGKIPESKRRRRLGHHPDCQGFNNHRVAIGNGTYCAGCLGLSLGAVAAIILTVLHAVVPYRLSGISLYVIIFLGLMIVLLNFAEITAKARNPFAHTFSNAFLVIGFLVVVLGVFELTGNMFYGLFGILISFLWLDTRIRLSKWRHHRICEDCGAVCKAY